MKERKVHTKNERERNEHLKIQKDLKQTKYTKNKRPKLNKVLPKERKQSEEN